MPFFDGATGSVHYRRWAVAEPAAVLVFLHGRGQHSGHYHRFARGLAGHGVELWALDHPGHGLSEGVPGAATPLAELAVNAVRLVIIAAQANPGQAPALMGHSLGAATALAAAPSASISALVLCGTPRAVLDDGGYVLPESLPLLAVHGTDDRLTPAGPVREWTSGQLADGANVRWIEYPDAGHDLLHEPAHPTVTADIARWLTSTRH